MKSIRKVLGMVTFCLALSACATQPVATQSPWLGNTAHAEDIPLQLPQTIKVALLQTRRPFTLGATGGYSYVSVSGGKSVELSTRTQLRVRGVRGGMLIGSKKFTSAVQVESLQLDSRLLLNKRTYRGTFFLKPNGQGSVQVIEQVSFEEYLNGVLPKEVGADWPAESLKAQAVISRTYVIAMIRRAASKGGYDVTNDVWSQVYGGLSSEKPATSQAVTDTRGQILIDEKGQPIIAFFHSSCGGRTETPSYVWHDLQNPPTDFESVRDPYCKDDPHNSWSRDIGAERIQNRLRRAGYRVGTIKKISPASESPSGRVRSFAVESSRGRAVVPGNNFRLAVGPEVLRSTYLTSLKKKGNVFHFEGKGWGHGVGLCQWGARGRALDGQSYKQILKAYYPNSRLVKTSGTKD